MSKQKLVYLLSPVIALLTACDQLTADKDTQQPPAPAPVAVTTMLAEPEDIPVRFEYIGQLSGSLEVEVRSRITGIIEQRHYQEGSEVKAGQLLFTLDAAQYQAEYQQALATLNSAKAGKVTADAQLRQAQRELKRVTPLAKKKMVSQSQQDDAISAVDIAKAQQAVAEAAIGQAEANLQSARINLDYTRIKAPVAGTAGRALQNRGALVQAGSNSLLTTLVQTDPIHVNFGVPENEQLRIRKELNHGSLRLPSKGFIVDLVDETGNSMGQDGSVDFQDYKVDNSTGNFAMRGILNNGNANLSPGQFVRVHLKGAEKTNAIALPQRAVLDGPSGKYVYIVAKSENNSTIAEQRAVTLGEWVDLGENRKNFWIVHSGLESGDEVIIDGVARIFFPGMPVSVSEGKQEQTAQ